MCYHVFIIIKYFRKQVGNRITENISGQPKVSPPRFCLNHLDNGEDQLN